MKSQKTPPCYKNPGLWIDETTATAWAEGCRREILAWLAPIAGEESDAFDDLQVEVFPPTQDEAKQAFKANMNLQGRVCVAWDGESMEIGIPMPFHGVFLSRRQESQRGFVSVWSNWLAEAPGFRLLSPTSEGKRDDVQWRVGLPGGKFVGATLDGKLNKKDQKRLQKLCYFGSPATYPDWLRSHLAVFGFRDVKGEAAMPRKWKTVLAKHEKDLPKQEEATDQDDLEHQILITFPVWLKHKISREMLDLVLGVKKDKLGKRVSAVLTGQEEGNMDLAQEVWETAMEGAARIADRLTSAIQSNQSSDHVDLIDPINPLDLVSRIMRVKRIHLSASKLAEMPAAFRQNHPSFQGRLCPVESPESEQVGLTLQLATGAKVDFDGRIQATDDSSLEPGYGAGLVPFFAHNDGARNMMGAKNLRQAMPVHKRMRPAVETGGEARVDAISAPLVEIGLCPDARTEDGGFGLGRDLLVAYLPWKGMNFEDAIVLGEQVVNDGLLDIAFRKTVCKNIPLGWVPEDPDTQTVNSWSENGLAKTTDDLLKKETVLFAGSPIARFIWEGKGDAEPMEVRYNDKTPAILKSIRFNRRTPWTGGKLEYELETPFPVKPGDKLMGRHGNKGVVGAILPKAEMPHLPDSDDLPKHLRGKPIDILLNPHGVISRMNLGQLIETHLGWVLHAGDFQIDQLTKDDSNSDALPAQAFSESLDHGKVRKALKETGLDEYGRVKLVLPDGGTTQSPVVVGFQHIVRLKHVPETKSQARRGGKDALYSARTGQAVRGRRMGGGQRVGEMEEWALSAHCAEAVLGEMLGLKSSVELARLFGQPDELDALPVRFNEFRHVLSDWLFALILDLKDEESGGVRLALTAPKKVLRFAGPWGKVTMPEGLRAAPSARFRCLEGGGKPCGYRLLDMLDKDKIAFPSTARGKKKISNTLCLGDLLAHLQLQPTGELKLVRGHYQLPLVDTETRQATHPLRLEFEFKPGSKSIRGVVKPISKKAPSNWPQELDEIHLYGQFSIGGGKGNAAAEDLLAEFQKGNERKRSVSELRIACPHHRTPPLSGVKPFTQTYRSTPGGLFDPMIFGDGLSKADEDASNHWGYIQLPVAVSYPLHLMLPGRGDPDKQKKAVEKFLEQHDLEPDSLPKIDLVPVMPVRYRMPTLRNGSNVDDAIDRKGYSPLIRLCRSYESKTETKQKEKIAKQIEAQVGVLFGMLLAAFRTKKGLIRRHGLGRRVDRSARLVVTPNPELEWDQAGVPAGVLLELIGDLAIAWAKGLDQSDAESFPPFEQISWRHPRADTEFMEYANKILEAFLLTHPDFVVLLNRQPSLHRDNFQALHPVLLPPEAGDVIQLCPLVCKGFAADFDGDEMVIHVPLGEAAQKEAAGMLPSNNLFSLANGQPNNDEKPDNVMAHFAQDFVLGTWWMGITEEDEGRQELIKSLPDKSLPDKCCSEILPSKGPISKDAGLELLHHLALHHPEDAPACIEGWMRMAFEVCSRIGVSFSYYELLDLADGITAEVDGICTGPDKDPNASLLDVATTTLETVLADPVEFTRPGLHFAAMALSGARGTNQVRQILAARGHLDPGATGFKRDDSKFFIPDSLVNGLSSDHAFWAAMNARSSMCDKKLGTGYAGGLTRHLVFALRGHKIVSEDCGNDLPDKQRNPVTCAENPGFCAKCYGELPDGTPTPLGFPVGLIAAQSIGERGTQLSMQSFHAGERGINIHGVRSILGVGPKPLIPSFFFNDKREAERFVKKMREAKAYSNLDKRHFRILWTILYRSPKVLLDVIKDGQVIGSVEDIPTLITVVEAGDVIDLMAYRDPDPILAEAVTVGIQSKAATPIAKVLL